MGGARPAAYRTRLAAVGLLALLGACDAILGNDPVTLWDGGGGGPPPAADAGHPLDASGGIDGGGIVDAGATLDSGGTLDSSGAKGDGGVEASDASAPISI